MKQKQIHDAISKMLVERLKSYQDEKLNKTTCSMIYQDMFGCLVDVFKESNVNITNEAMNLLTQMYYDTVTINSNGSSYELDPTIFDRRASVKSIETKELALLATMMNGTIFAVPFIAEIKHRS